MFLIRFRSACVFLERSIPLRRPDQGPADLRGRCSPSHNQTASNLLRQRLERPLLRGRGQNLEMQPGPSALALDPRFCHRTVRPEFTAASFRGFPSWTPTLACCCWPVPSPWPAARGAPAGSRAGARARGAWAPPCCPAVCEPGEGAGARGAVVEAPVVPAGTHWQWCGLLPVLAIDHCGTVENLQENRCDEDSACVHGKMSALWSRVL